MTENIRDTWSTPGWLFDKLHAQLRFTVDACASERNHKLDRYWDLDTDGLAQDWSKERVWVNPPYSGKQSKISDWLEKGKEAELALFLLPARTDQKWFHDHALRAPFLAFIRGRVQFDPPPGIKASTNREGSILVGYSKEFGDRCIVSLARGGR